MNIDFNRYDNQNFTYSAGNTNSVQGFIRFIVFFVSFLIGFFIFVIPLGGLSAGLFDDNPIIFGAPTLFFVLWVSSIVSRMFYVLPEYEKMVILRLGKFDGIRGAGFFIIPPFIYSVAAIVDTRLVTYQVEATATLTKDNVPTTVTAAIEYQVEDPQKAVIDVRDYKNSVTWLSTEALKNTIGSLDLKELLSERDQIAKSLRDQIDADAAIYGLDVKAVRITDIDTPPALVEELAVIARARRSADAKLIQANAEVEVARKTAEASEILVTSHGGLRLRELQVLSEISKDHGSMVIVYPYGDRDGKEIASASISRGKN